jgi:hypothetical protein
VVEQFAEQQERTSLQDGDRGKCKGLLTVAENAGAKKAAEQRRMAGAQAVG